MFWEDLRASVGRIKHTNIKHNMYKSEGWKTIIEASFYTKVEIESIDLSVTNGTFVTKYKFENNFWTTATEEPILNYWVIIQLNQLVIQFEPPNRCFFKVSFKFMFFSKKLYQAI